MNKETVSDVLVDEMGDTCLVKQGNGGKGGKNTVKDT